MKFYKYQGAGNDFLIADNRDGHITEKDGVLTAVLEDGTLWSRKIEDLCDRRYGVGADGLMLLDPGKGDDDFQMTYFNSDGSGGMMCGNGGRCMVAFAKERKPIIVDQLMVQKLLPDFTDAKVVRVNYEDGCKVYFDDRSFVICRFSGTEPLLRIFAEASTPERAQSYIDAFKNLLGLN